MSFLGYKMYNKKEIDKRLQLCRIMCICKILISSFICILVLCIDIVAIPLSKAYFVNLRLTGRMVLVIFDTFIILITVLSFLSIVLNTVSLVKLHLR